MKSCNTCGRDLVADEPYVSFDFLINRTSEEHEGIIILEHHELTTHCVPCGYDARDSLSLATLGMTFAGQEVEA